MRRRGARGIRQNPKQAGPLLPIPQKKFRHPDDCKQCVYCDIELDVVHEHDHFPARHGDGGEELVPTCQRCHTLKDTISLDRWPREMLFEVWYGMAPAARLFVARVVAGHIQQMRQREKESVRGGRS